MDNEAAVIRIKANMPALDLEALLGGKRLLGTLLGVHRPDSMRGKQISDGFVRLVEKAILEYQACRERFFAFHEKGSFDDRCRAQDHFETSIQSAHRAIAYLERLRTLNLRQVSGAPFIPRPRDLEVLRSDVKSKVHVFRDFAEHLEDDIICDRLPADEEVGIHLGWEKASLNQTEIVYIDLIR